MTTPVIQTESLTKKFGHEIALQAVSLKIDSGQVVGLIGTNGSGKTTLIKCLLGLLRPTSGACQIFGEDSWWLSEKAKAKLGYVPQTFPQVNWMSVQGICDYTGAFYENWDYGLVKKLLSEWSVDPYKKVHKLSVGQQQKLSVILAFGHRPSLLILDEPVASLDPIARRQFLQSLIDFSGPEQTVLFSTHITSDLERIATHIAMMATGNLKFFGELDLLKESCKRIRIHSETPLPDDLELPGILRRENNGLNTLLAVDRLDQAELNRFREKYQAQVSVEDLNLEDIFLELSGASSHVIEMEV